jgi:3'-5' exoribonuclease
VSELKEGSVDSIFFVLEKRNGSLLLKDKSGVIEGLYSGKNDISEDDFVHIAGTVIYDGNLKIKIDKAERVPPEKIDIFDFIPSSKRDIDEMVKELYGVIESIKDTNLKELLKRVFTEDFVKDFKLCPAATYYHHSYLGGLIEHTLSVVKICDVVARLYDLNRDLLITGALLHDIGKVREYSWFPKISVTVEGGFSGHPTLGAHMLSKLIPQDFPEDLKIKIYHMILSHHGEIEYGAVVPPKFREAYALHLCEYLDAKLKEFSEEEEEIKKGGKGSWEYSKKLRRYIYRE